MDVTGEHKEPAVDWPEALGEDAANPATPALGDTITLYHDCPDCDGKGQLEGVECDLCRGKGKSGEIKEQHQVSTLENRIKAQFCLWVRSGAMEAVAEQQNPEMQAVLASAYTSDYGAKLYGWDGRHVRKALGDIPGRIQLLYLLLRRCDPAMTEKEARRIFSEAPAACVLAMAWAQGNSESPPKPKAGGKPSGMNRGESVIRTPHQTLYRSPVNPLAEAPGPSAAPETTGPKRTVITREMIEERQKAMEATFGG